MISKKLQDAINAQVNKELFSAYLYAAMSAKATEMNYRGTAKWMMVQAKEEMGHAMKFLHYLQEQGATVALKAIEQPPARFSSVLDMFEKTLAHEKSITASINGLMDIAVKEKDYASSGVLQWFVTEQVEEEANASEIVAQLKMIGDKSSAVFMIDHHLGKREG